MKSLESLTYASSGVDINKANNFIQVIKTSAKQTLKRGASFGEIGGFGCFYPLKLANVESPVLVSSTDGVGTKLKIAFMMNKHDTVGIDLVAMNVNDIAVCGAKPLFFLDYIAMGNLDVKIAKDIVKGIVEGCKMADCALIGGETAEMPGIYQNGEYDLAGFVVGMVDNKKIIDGSNIRVGHKLISITSSGLHSNGFSLVRKICFDVLKLNIDSYIPELGKTLGEELITPTRIYSELIQKIIKNLPIDGLAHITGGGISEKLLRIIPDSCGVLVYKNKWSVPNIFKFLQQAGNITELEMMRTFNNGIGIIAVVPDNLTIEVLSRLKAMGEDSQIIGEVIETKSEFKERMVFV